MPRHAYDVDALRVVAYLRESVSYPLESLDSGAFIMLPCQTSIGNPVWTHLNRSMWACSGEAGGVGR